MNAIPRSSLAPPKDEPDQPRARGRQSGPFGVLDIGTSKIVCAIARTESDGTNRILGFGWQRGVGVRSGGITDIDQAERAIRAAVGQAEHEADTRLRGVTVNLSCGQPESRLFNVQWPVGARAVTELDIRRVIMEGRNRATSEQRDIIHTLPLTFSADDAHGIHDPRGLHCEILTARLHIVDAVRTSLLTLSSCLARCDLNVVQLVSAPMVAAMATLVEDERQLGCTVLDMGGGGTGMAVFADGQLLHTAHIPIGGTHVTNDIARVLSTPLAHAERLKTLFGSAHGSPDDDREMLPVPMVGEEEHQISKVPRSMVVGIIKPRVEQTFELVRDQLEGSGLGRAAGSHVVLTGGASQLNGVREIAHRVLGRTVRLGRPPSLRGLPDIASGPGFATTVGLISWTAGAGRTLDVDLEPEAERGALRRLIHFLRGRV